MLEKLIMKVEACGYFTHLRCFLFVHAVQAMHSVEKDLLTELTGSQVIDLAVYYS